MKKNIVLFPVQKKPRRRAAVIRKTSGGDEALEKKVMRATKEIIEAHGFAALTEQAVVGRAGVDRRKYRARYKNLQVLVREFVSMNDYWLGNLSVGICGTLGIESFVHQTCLNLVRSLYNDRVMQRMLIWELDSDNEITREIAKLRETKNRSLVNAFAKHAEVTGEDIPALMALLVGGIYYMILHSGRSTFCGVDFSTVKGKKRLADAINFMVQTIYAKRPVPTGGAPKLQLVKG